MKKTVSYSKSQLLDDLGRLALMVLASVIMAVNLKSFVQAGDLVPGGFNGLTLLDVYKRQAPSPPGRRSPGWPGWRWRWPPWYCPQR